MDCFSWSEDVLVEYLFPWRKEHFQQFQVDFSPQRKQMCSSASPDSHSVKQLLLSAGFQVTEVDFLAFHSFKFRFCTHYLNPMVSTAPKEPQALIKS